MSRSKNSFDERISDKRAYKMDKVIDWVIHNSKKEVPGLLAGDK